MASWDDGPLKSKEIAVSKKQRAAMLMEAAKRVNRGDSWFSCSAISDASWEGYNEAYKYADYVGINPKALAFDSSYDRRKYSDYEQKLTRELAILMYREAVLAGEV